MIIIIIVIIIIMIIIIMIDQNTEKGPVDLRRPAVTQISVKDRHLTLV